MGYSALVMAHTISGTLSTRTTGICLVATAALAALTTVVLDLSSDPMQSTVLGDWIWRTDGAYFGVSIQNFWGWFITTFTFFVIVALLFLRRSAAAHVQTTRSNWFYLQGPLLYTEYWLPVVLRPLLEASTNTARPGVSSEKFPSPKPAQRK